MLMVLDIIIDKDSITIEIPQRFQPDLDAIEDKITRFASTAGADIDGLDIRNLIPKMIRGIAGCEKGCPANAKSLVTEGFKNFKLDYIEGGILSAHAALKNDRHLYLKMFPDF